MAKATVSILRRSIIEPTSEPSIWKVALTSSRPPAVAAFVKISPLAILSFWTLSLTARPSEPNHFTIRPRPTKARILELSVTLRCILHFVAKRGKSSLRPPKVCKWEKLLRNQVFKIFPLFFLNGLSLFGPSFAKNSLNNQYCSQEAGRQWLIGQYNEHFWWKNIG